MQIVARYRFSSRSQAEAALARLKDRIPYGIYFGGDTIDLGQECKDLAFASDVCRAHGGVPY